MLLLKKINVISLGILIFISTIFIIKYESRYTTETFNEQNENIKLPIVMYHNISKKAALLNRYTISLTQFENDLKYIKESGYTSITVQELLDYVYNNAKLPEKPIMITFDDGYESFYVYAYPLLQKYNMKAVMSIVGSYTDLFTKEEDHNVDYSHLNWEQVFELNNSGFTEIENHTYDMHKITAQRKGCGKGKNETIEQYKKVLKSDLNKLQKQILNYTGKEATVFTYPYGHMSEGSLDVIKEMGFKAVFTCTEVVNIIDGKEDILFNLGRFNRENGLSSSEFFKRMFSENAKINIT